MQAASGEMPGSGLRSEADGFDSVRSAANAASAPKSGEHRNDLLFSGHHAGQEAGVVLKLRVERVGENILVSDIKDLRAL